MIRLSKSVFLMVLTLLFFIGGLLLIRWTGVNMQRSGLENRQIQKETESQLAITSFKKEMDKFAFLVLGIRNQIESIDNIPTPEDLQKLLLAQLKGMNFDNPIVISYVDSNHVFQYSITSTTINANTLAGKSVKSIRDASEIARLDNLMKSDELLLFPPLNLIEGWVGIPVSFRLKRDGKSVGYFAPIVDFKAIIEEIYKRPSSREFVYKFTYNDDLIFDRHTVHDGSKIYTDLRDAEFFKNFDRTSSTDFFENSFSCFGAKFNIGVAYKEAYKLDVNQVLLLRSWYFIITMMFAVISLFLYWQNKKREELEAQRDQLKSYNEAMERFTYATSHDLKEPLRTIGSFSSLIERRYKEQLDEKGKEYLGFIMRNVSRMNVLLEDLLKYTRLVNDNDLPKEVIPFGEVISDVRETLYSSLNESKTQLTLDEAYPCVYITRMQIHQVLQNLVSNAIKFSDKEICKIHIGCERQGAHNVFFVKDNGIGINEAYHEKIFESFQQLNKNNYDGSGLGLAICKKIIEYHNGRIWVKSKENEGSTFYFSLPTVEENHN